MFSNQALPLIHERFGKPTDLSLITLKSTGIGESMAEDKIRGPLQDLVNRGLTIGYCARVGEVDIRLSAQGKQSQNLVSEAEQIVHQQIGKHIFGTGDDSLEAIVVRALAEQKQTLALAESCTGGFIANRITNVSGASAVFQGGAVTYSNGAKQALLNVSPETLAAYGAVSEQTAAEMAKGALHRFGSDYALSVTGIAGPTGGTPEKPVGTVFIGFAAAQETTVVRQLNQFDRETFKFLTSQQALEILRRKLKKA